MQNSARASSLMPTSPFILIARTYLFGLVWFAMYRASLVLLFRDRAGDADWTVLAQTFAMGWRFDTVVLLILLAPLIILNPWLRLERKSIYIATLTYLSLGFTIILFGLIADIRYFANFDTHLNFMALQYLTTGGSTTWHVIVTEPYFALSLLIWAAVMLVVIYMLRRIVWRAAEFSEKTSWTRRIGWAVLAIGLAMLGIRGGTGLSPISWGVAYLGQNEFINQLGLNGVYTFGKALTEEGGDPRLVYTPEQFRFPFVPVPEAVDSVRAMLATPRDTWLEPRATLRRRTVNPEKFGFSPNVVLVVMESWSGRYTGCLGSPLGLTPRLDSLAAHGILLTDFYATGTRTSYGLAGLFCSFPSVPGRAILNRYHANHPFVSLPQILDQRVYDQTFAYGGDLAFDNMRGFLTAEGVDRFIGEEDFGRARVFAKWGVPDHVVFDQLAALFDSLPRPFALTALTLSNHEPFDLPDSSVQVYFDDSEESRIRNAHRYADFALGRFMDSLASHPGFDSTIFVFVADHTKWIAREPSPHPDQFHIPMVIYSPALLGNHGRRIKTTGSQVDLLPTLMGLLGGTYEHASWGRDLLALSPADSGFAVVNVLNRIAMLAHGHIYSEWVGLPPTFTRVDQLTNFVLNPDAVRSDKSELFDKLQRRTRVYAQLADRLSTPLAGDRSPRQDSTDQRPLASGPR